VPGHFHIEARSKHHNLNPTVANVSHIVNDLSFGPIRSRESLKMLKRLPREYFNMDSTQPLNDKPYVTKKLHQAFHHYIKVK
jgi:hypothetical protein